MDFHETWVANARTRLIAASLAGGNVAFDDGRPSTDEELPKAYVMVGSDDLKPDGDPRTGIVGFEHTTKLGVEVKDHANNLIELKTKLAVHSQKIADALFPDLLGWAANAEGCGGVQITYQYEPDGEVPTGRVTVVFDLLSRSLWSPSTAGLPDLTTVSVGTGNGPGITIPVPTP